MAVVTDGGGPSVFRHCVFPPLSFLTQRQKVLVVKSQDLEPDSKV